MGSQYFSAKSDRIDQLNPFSLVCKKSQKSLETTENDKSLT